MRLDRANPKISSFPSVTHAPPKCYNIREKDRLSDRNPIVGAVTKYRCDEHVLLSNLTNMGVSYRQDTCQPVHQKATIVVHD